MLCPGSYPGNRVQKGTETWSKNWAGLLNAKTQEGAYSWLKVFVKSDSIVEEIEKAKKGPTDEEDEPSAPAAHGRDGGDGAGEMPEAWAAGGVEGERQQIKSRMTLFDLARSGVSMFEKGLDYVSLFEDTPDMVTATDMKLLELRLELFLWDWVVTNHMQRPNNSTTQQTQLTNTNTRIRLIALAVACYWLLALQRLTHLIGLLQLLRLLHGYCYTVTEYLI